MNESCQSNPNNFSLRFKVSRFFRIKYTLLIVEYLFYPSG